MTTAATEPGTRSGRPAGLRLGVYRVGEDGQRAELVPAHQVDTGEAAPLYPGGWPECECARCRPSARHGQVGERLTSAGGGEQ